MLQNRLGGSRLAYWLDRGSNRLLTGGTGRRVGKTLEFSGGLITTILCRMNRQYGGVAAMTLGHVIIGQSEETLEYARVHEWIHVKQYEKWGPAFLPAYLVCSLYCSWKGGCAYHDNPFEREAFGNDGRYHAWLHDSPNGFDSRKQDSA